MKRIARIGVAGGGAWGTTLALLAARGGAQVHLWAREPEVAESIRTKRINPFLPDITLDENLAATADIAELAGSGAVLLAAPAQHLREVCQTLAPHAGGVPAVICAKGIEGGSGALLSEVVAQAMPGSPIAVLSGPTFAAEVARGLPTAVTLACSDAELGAALVTAIGAPEFRPYLSGDVVGAQIGGAVKNVLAIACGVVTGRGLGDNARSALMTRGMAELLRLGAAMGAEPETLLGLCGLGDLVLTCTSLQSRNYSLGIALGEDKDLGDVLAARTSVAEGVATAGAVITLAGRLGVEMPICAAVHDVVHRGAAIGQTIRGLLDRPFRNED